MVATRLCRSHGSGGATMVCRAWIGQFPLVLEDNKMLTIGSVLRIVIASSTPFLWGISTSESR